MYLDDLFADHVPIEGIINHTRQFLNFQNERIAALTIAKRRDRRGLPLLTEIISDSLEHGQLNGDYGTLAAAVYALGELNDTDGIQPLVRVVSHLGCDDRTRYIAMLSLGRLGAIAEVLEFVTGPAGTLRGVLNSHELDARLRIVALAIRILGETRDPDLRTRYLVQARIPELRDAAIDALALLGEVKYRSPEMRRIYEDLST